jgi:hypothetical protein
MFILPNSPKNGPICGLVLTDLKAGLKDLAIRNSFTQNVSSKFTDSVLSNDEGQGYSIGQTI